MQIQNPFQMNDWGIKRFLTVVLALQAAVGILVALEAAGIQVPVVRQVVSFVYLTFFPGLLLLRVLKLHKLGNAQTLVYSVGLSLATIMFTGLLMNTLYPSLGILRPITTVPLTITLGVVVLGLCILSYVRDRGFGDPDRMDVSLAISPPALSLLLLPFLAIFGTYLVNEHQYNVLLMALIVIVALVAVLVGFGKFVPRGLYPLAIFSIALSLLFYRSLISQYVSGYDIHEEYHSANLVIATGHWDFSNTIFVNGMLSITMLAPVFRLITAIDLTSVLKIAYPLWFSFGVLGLYPVFRSQTSDKVTFLSCFFFVEAAQFYTDLPVILRQQVATVFLVLLTLTMINGKIDRAKRMFLSIVLGASLAVSHYGLSYMYVFYLFAAWLILVLLGNPGVRRWAIKLQSRLGATQKTSKGTWRIRETTVSPGLALLLTIFATTWYMYSSGSVVFNGFAVLGRNIVSSLGEFLNPQFSGGLNVLLTPTKTDALHLFNAGINYLNQVLLVVGIAALLFKWRPNRFTREYSAFSVISLAIVVAGVLLPYFTRQVNIDRVYHVTLMFLSPFAVIGGLTIFVAVRRVIKVPWKTTVAFSLLSLYLAVFFLFQTGFVWQLTQGYSGSLSISQEGFRKFSDDKAKVIRLYGGTTAAQDVFSARWLSAHRVTERKIYATFNDTSVHALLSYGMIPPKDVAPFLPWSPPLPEDTYVYLQYFNIVEGLSSQFDAALPLGLGHNTFSMSEVVHLFAGKNKIYSNGGSEVYR